MYRVAAILCIYTLQYCGYVYCVNVYNSKVAKRVIAMQFCVLK